jgi:dihydroorotate dehydrogenase
MWFLIRSFLFLLPAEFTHHLSIFFMRIIAPLLPPVRSLERNKVGLAAGFDKNAEILTLLPKFGFGFAEIGTVTPKPQGGNEKPRLFRDYERTALFNRMGFNNLGAGIISDRVRAAKKILPADFKVGVNLGKNKLTPDTEAATDYVKAAERFLDCADYFVINVSSPNTPGLRSLQKPEYLIPIVRSVQELILKSSKIIPLYVKLAPELDESSLREIILALEGENIAGLVLTNTLSGIYIYRGKEYQGGYSGRPLTELSLQRLKEVRQMTSLPIMSVGGIMSVEDAVARFKAGANQIQIYSGWIYRGPLFIREIVRKIGAIANKPDGL